MVSPYLNWTIFQSIKISTSNKFHSLVMKTFVLAQVSGHSWQALRQNGTGAWWKTGRKRRMEGDAEVKLAVYSSVVIIALPWRVTSRNSASGHMRLEGTSRYKPHRRVPVRDYWKFLKPCQPRWLLYNRSKFTSWLAFRYSWAFEYPTESTKIQWALTHYMWAMKHQTL